MNLGLRDLRKLKRAGILNDGEIEKLKCSSVSIDSRNCRLKDLFFAVKGERFDGHNFVKNVLSNGNPAAVVSKEWYKKLNNSEKRSFKNKCLILFDDTIRSLGELANIYRKKFVLPVIGCAGSNGKTSTKDFIANILSKKYNVLKTEGNQNNAIGVPLTLFRLNPKHEIAVIELGTNHFGEIKYLCKIARPQFGIITNIGKEHLEFLKNIKGVSKAEGELADYLKGLKGTYFLNLDDKYLMKLSDRRK